jgi:uncharacterized damage-inducible protein DinB
MADMFVDRAADPRTFESSAEGELATYRDYLTNYRLTLELKTRDLSPDQLATRSVPPSALSLLGLVRHMVRVEHFWFQVALQGRSVPRIYDDGDAGFAQVEPTQECVDDGFSQWREQIAVGDAWLDTQSDDTMAEMVTFRDGETGSARDILVHMIEEYARHCGHADLLRECIDGRVGQ